MDNTKVSKKIDSKITDYNVYNYISQVTCTIIRNTTNSISRNQIFIDRYLFIPQNVSWSKKE